jgi:hypothetical protein
VDIEDFDIETIEILSRTVFKMILTKQEGWEKLIPNGVACIIKEKELFGYKK